MSIRNTDVKVYLYNNDYNRLCTEIYRHQRIETGGNLFGLWTTTGNAVVHVALGPGKQCRRTDVSFHQDIPYLSRVGTFLTQKFMLCHIGEWHSHHRLSLNKPSSGDNRTVRENYPNGIKKFLVIIGNIVGTDHVILSPYFFSDGGNTCEKGKLEVLTDTDSPFTTDLTIAKEMNEGAESPSHDLIRSCSPNKDQQQTTPSDRSGAISHSQQSRMDVSSNSGDRSPGTGPQNSAHPLPSGSHARAATSGGSSPADKKPFEVKPPPNNVDTSVPSQTTPIPSDHPAASNNPSTLIPTSPNEVKSDDSNNQTRQEVILKKVFDEIKSKFVDSGIAIERSRAAGVIEMKFKHNNSYWLLKFPESFPEKPAEIYNSYSEQYVGVGASNYARNPKVLNNHIDILLAIKRQSHCLSCSACQKLNVQSLDQTSTPELFLTKKGCAMMKELCDKVKDTSLAEAGSLKKEMKYDDVKEYAFLQVCFKHGSKFWAVDVRSTFPSCPAKLCTKDLSSRSYWSIPYESGQYSSKDWAKKVLFAIAKSCDCTDCRRSQFH